MVVHWFLYVSSVTRARLAEDGVQRLLQPTRNRAARRVGEMEILETGIQPSTPRAGGLRRLGGLSPIILARKRTFNQFGHHRRAIRPGISRFWVWEEFRVIMADSP
jgi:hypothetical protein